MALERYLDISSNLNLFKKIPSNFLIFLLCVFPLYILHLINIIVDAIGSQLPKEQCVSWGSLFPGPSLNLNFVDVEFWYSFSVFTSVTSSPFRFLALCFCIPVSNAIRCIVSL